MAFTPLVRISVADRVATQLRDAIANGVYAPGQALPSERELVDLLGVSRVSVRVALQALQDEALIDRSHGRAARVSPKHAEASPVARMLHLPDLPDEKTVQDAKQARVLVEVAMVRMVAASIDDAGVAVLRAALQANRDAIFVDRAAFLQTDLAVHRSIAGLCGNTLFTAMANELLDWLELHQTDVVYLEGVDLISHREHARVVELIVAHDAEGAAKAMTAHLTRSHEGYEPFIARQEKALPVGVASAGD
jgi:GntR family transcriptional regulator, sialic acid-inducible nan operon repressor